MDARDTKIDANHLTIIASLPHGFVQPGTFIPDGFSNPLSYNVIATFSSQPRGRWGPSHLEHGHVSRNAAMSPAKTLIVSLTELCERRLPFLATASGNTTLDVVTYNLAGGFWDKWALGMPAKHGKTLTIMQYSKRKKDGYQCRQMLRRCHDDHSR
jgi:hypothetical protein